MAKYDPLRELLAGTPADQAEMTLSFKQVEQALSDSLPQTAKMDRTWWANTRSSNHARSWLDAGWVVGAVSLSNGFVRFIRPSDASRKTKATYGQLRIFLESVPAGQRQLAMTFSELAEIIQHALPRTASHDEPWWANTVKTSPQGSAWLEAGWRVEKVFLKARTVVFRRAGANPLRVVPRHVSDILEHKGTIPRIPAAVLCDWIRFCRRVGWHFQGVVLYERGGLTMEALSESDQAGVEEDYRACKQALSLYKNTVTATS